jgi:HK97 family phage major capsid protein
MSATTLDAAELVKQFEQAIGKKIDESRAEDRAAFEKFVDDKIKAANAEMERKLAVHSLPGSADATHNGKKYDLAGVLSAVVRNDFSSVQMEKAMSDEIRRKTMTFADAEAGGFFVPAEQSPEIIRKLYATSVVKAMGARVLPLSAAPFTQTRISGGCTAGWGSEIATITGSGLTTQQMTLNPRRLAAVAPISDLLQILQNNGAVSELEADMGQAMGLELDLAAMTGNGVPGAEPRGIINLPVQTETLSDPATYDQWVAFRSKVRGANALVGSLGWVMSNADMLELEQIKDTTSGTDTNVQPLGSRSLLTGEGENVKVLGYRAMVSTQLSDGQVIFGNWNDLVIGQWGGVRFDRTNAVGFLTGESHIRAVTYADIGVRHFESFCIPA